MARPEGGVYGRDYYLQVWSTINHFPPIGEGMAMLNLEGLAVEPVFMGLRSRPGREPIKLFVRECIKDMADNHGSSFRGPRSFWWEGHETLRAADRETARTWREQIICYLLSQKEDINEVIVYELYKWLYDIPISDTEQCSHAFLDRCEEILEAGGWERENEP